MRRLLPVLLCFFLVSLPTFAQDRSVSGAKSQLQQRGEQINRLSFEHAVVSGDSVGAALFLEAGFDPTKRMQSLDVESALYPLSIAASHGHRGVVTALLEHGANPDRNSFLSSPMHSAVAHPDVIRVLIGHRASLETVSNTGSRPIHSTLLGQDTTWTVLNETLRVLLENGANPNSEIEKGQLEGANALFLAALEGRPRAAQILIEHGARPDLQLKNFERREGPLSRIAREVGNDLTARALEKAGM